MKTHVLDYNKDIINNKTAIAAIGVVFFVLATALGAYVRIPVNGSPVPITLQTFFVLLSGAMLGRKLGSFSQFAYFILGVSGLPIFQAAGFGTAYLLGPTTGYLIGFIFAAYSVGRIIEFRPKDTLWAAISFIIGSLIIYGFGAAWLVYIYKISFIKAVSIGILPFVPGDIIKISLATIIYSRISQRSKNIFSV